MAPPTKAPFAQPTEAAPRWWDLSAGNEPPASQDAGAAVVPAEARRVGCELLAADVTAWERSKERSEDGDDRYMKQVLRSGTMADKVAAMTILVQESPVHRLSTLDSLMALALKKERRTSRMAVESLKDLFASHLLPDGRRLRTMEQQPLASAAAAIKKGRSGGGAAKGGGGGGAAEAAASLRLIVWYFEEQVRERYGQLVQLLAQGMRETAIEARSVERAPVCRRCPPPRCSRHAANASTRRRCSTTRVALTLSDRRHRPLASPRARPLPLRPFGGNPPLLRALVRHVIVARRRPRRRVGRAARSSSGSRWTRRSSCSRARRSRRRRYSRSS